MNYIWDSNHVKNDLQSGDNSRFAISTRMFMLMKPTIIIYNLVNTSNVIHKLSQKPLRVYSPWLIRQNWPLIVLAVPLPSIWFIAKNKFVSK